jgi:hypothetical protein
VTSTKPRADRSRWADVPETWRDELSDDTLREMAGDAVFERGLTYFNESRVTLARDGGGNATFKVSGTQTYSTELYFEDLGLHVDCNCPHGQDGHFCKHMVAAGLFWRGHLGGDAPAPSKAKAPSARAAKAALTKARKRDDLQAFVESRDAAALASLLWHWAERDRELMAELNAWAATEQAGADPALLKKALDALLVSTREFLPYREAFAYALRAGKSIKLLEAALARDPVQALGAAEHALRRLYRVAEHADDSSGEIGGVMQSCIEVVQRALACKPPPAAWAERFIGLFDDDPFGLWDVNAVLDAAGAEVTARYGKVLATRWAAIEAGRGKGDAKKEVSWGTGGARTEADHERDRIRRLMLGELERHGDVATVIDFMKRSARRDHEHLQVIQYCEKHGREREALALAEAAHKRDPKSFQFEDAVLRCWERDGWDEKAFALRKQRYWRSANLAEYVALLRAAKAARQPLDALRADVEAMLVAREKKAPATPAWAARGLSRDRGVDVSLRARWLLYEGRIGEALALVKTPSACHAQVLMDIAQRLDASANADAFTLIDRVARADVERSQGRYDEAIERVGLACRRLDSAHARQYLAQLRSEYKAKRNFVKALDTLQIGDGEPGDAA